MNGTNLGTIATVINCAKVSKCAEMRGFGEMAEGSIAAVLKTSAENIALPLFSAKPAQICAEISAFPVRSRRTSRHASRHSEAHMAKADHTPEHRAQVAAILRDYPGSQATGFPQAIRALRKRLGFDDGTDDTDDECAMRMDFVPDAFRLNEAECEIEVYEVEVTHHVPAVKWHRLGYFWSEWDAEDVHEWLPVLILVDRRGHHMRVDLCDAYHDLLSRDRPGDARLNVEAEV